MTATERTGNRLPRFYKHWQEKSLIFSVLRALCAQSEDAGERITDLMRAHWVDTAEGIDLDRLAVVVGVGRMSGEDDEHFKTRVKRAVNDYRGGGTVSAIVGVVRILIGSRNEEDVKIIENPFAEASAEFSVVAGDTWTLGSRSIDDVRPSLTLNLEEEGRIMNPEVMNIDSSESIGFKGKLKTGEQLVIKGGKALIGELDVSKKVSSETTPRLLRRRSTWKYSEALLEQIGVFDSAKFDEHTFAVGVPTVKVRFDWTRKQPATFLVQIKAETLRESGFTESQVKEVVDSMKPAGVNALIEVVGGD